MHPNNKKKQKRVIQSDINLKKPRDRINIPMSLDALPDLAQLNHVPFQAVGFYMLVWMTVQELKTEMKHMPVDTENYTKLENREETLHNWMLQVEEHLPVWFSVRNLK